MAANRHPLRERILSRINRGELASVREIMLVASIPRQTANRWLREAGIELDVARQRMLAKMHEQEERYLAGLPPKRKPSKRFLRKIATKAKADWDKRHAQPEGIPPHSG
jgi:hypothetical protein